MKPSADRAHLIEAAIRAGGETLLRPPPALTRGPAGINLGSGSGTSIDFHDFREYQPGDDLRRVDWAACARGSGLMLRLYREEISPVTEILIDQSKSMAVEPFKERAALCLAGFLAGATRRSGGRPVLVLDGARYSAEGFESGLGRCDFRRSGPPAPLPGSGQSGRPLRYLISDFLFPADAPVFLRRHSRGAACLFPVQILTAEECNPSVRGGVKLVDSEEEERHCELYLDSAAVTRYEERLKRHRESLEEGSRRLESRLTTLLLPRVEEDLPALLERIKSGLIRSGAVTMKQQGK